MLFTRQPFFSAKMATIYMVGVYITILLHYKMVIYTTVVFSHKMDKHTAAGPHAKMAVHIAAVFYAKMSVYTTYAKTAINMAADLKP